MKSHKSILWAFLILPASKAVCQELLPFNHLTHSLCLLLPSPNHCCSLRGLFIPEAVGFCLCPWHVTHHCALSSPLPVHTFVQTLSFPYPPLSDLPRKGWRRGGRESEASHFSRSSLTDQKREGLAGPFPGLGCPRGSQGVQEGDRDGALSLSLSLKGSHSLLC